MDLQGEPIALTTQVMPTPHAVLCATRMWKSWAFPLLKGWPARGQRLRLAEPLWKHVDAASIDEAAVGAMKDDAHELVVEDVQAVAVALRQLLQIEGCSQHLQQEALFHLDWLQDLRSRMVQL